MSSQNPKTGLSIARGTCRLLQSYNFATLTEFVPTRGLRVDIMALGPKGEFWVIECKSCRADYVNDHKWQGYLEWADRYFWAVDPDFPIDILPVNSGLIIADSYDGEIIRMPETTPLPPARRKKNMLKFGRNAADRLMSLLDA